MSTPWVVLRLLFFYLCSSLFIGAVGWVFFGPKAFVAAPATVFACSMIFWLTLESRLIAFCRAVETPSPGLSHSYRRALEDAALVGPPPELRVVPSPALQLLVARAFGGNGLLLISQGLLGLLNENELRAVLARGALRAQGADTPIRSFASWVALKLLRRAPSQWLSVSYEVAPDRAAPGSLTPKSLFAFLLVLPLIRFFLAMSLLDSLEKIVSAREKPSEDLNSALHKVHRAIQTWRLTATPVRYPFL